MARSKVVARVLDGDRLECTIQSAGGDVFTLTGNSTDVEPTVEGSLTQLSENRALRHNAWAFTQFTLKKVSLETEDEQRIAEKRARDHRAVATWIADVADDLADDGKVGWCSGCYARTTHLKSRLPAGHLRAYACSECGTPTLGCVAPGCMSMAVRSRGAVRMPQYCAEHRHDIPSFARANQTIRDPSDYGDLFSYDRRNLRRTTQVAGLAAAAIPGAGAAALFAAPAIGGAVGTLVGGYYGAAATSYGLAMLGGGSLASGGLGMAGGAAVITAIGGTVGCALGASVAHAYLREDESFAVEKLREGDGVPVVVCNGFLTENSHGWGEWEEIITRRYPDSPVYRILWGAKELKKLAAFVGAGAAKSVTAAGVKKAALKATKAAAIKLGPLNQVLMVGDLAKSPWHVARSRAEKTGVIVADLLARTEARSYVLVGHSLGARAMVVATKTLGTKPGGPRVQDVHLLGAAIGAKSEWATLTGAVDGAVLNYHSSNDKVLKILYRVAQGGQSAAGLNGFAWQASELRNVDVSAQVADHGEYISNVDLL